MWMGLYRQFTSDDERPWEIHKKARSYRMVAEIVLFTIGLILIATAVILFI